MNKFIVTVLACFIAVTIGLTIAYVDSTNDNIKYIDKVIELTKTNDAYAQNIGESMIVIAEQTKEINELKKQLDDINKKFDLIKKDDVNLLASVMYAEARGESSKCMQYVGEVVLNRVDAGYGDTIKEVVYQENQFAVVDDGQIKLKPNDTAKIIATKLLLGERELPNNVLAFRADYYHNGSSYKDFISVDNTYFSIVR